MNYKEQIETLVKEEVIIIKEEYFSSHGFVLFKYKNTSLEGGVYLPNINQKITVRFKKEM